METNSAELRALLVEFETARRQSVAVMSHGASGVHPVLLTMLMN